MSMGLHSGNLIFGIIYIYIYIYIYIIYIWTNILLILYCFTLFHLLINSCLILGKHFLDPILVHSRLIFLQLYCFCMEPLFSSFATVLIPFFMLYFLSSFLYCSSLLISPLKMFMCFLTLFINFLILFFY